MCSREIETTGKRGAPPVYCTEPPPGAAPGTPSCKELADRRYMRDYMRRYRSDGATANAEPLDGGGPVPVAAVRRDT